MTKTNNELLIRIDERVKATHNTIIELSNRFDKLEEKLEINCTDVELLKEDNRNYKKAVWIIGGTVITVFITALMNLI